MPEGALPLISFVVPVFDEEHTLEEFNRRLRGACAANPALRYEIIYINDGSRDRSAEILTSLTQRFPEARAIHLSRNFGHQIAITAGIDHADGDAVVVIDGDLQDPPEVALKMVEKWKEGYQVVFGVRSRRKGEGWFKLATASLFYRVLRFLSDVDLPLDAGDFRLMDRMVVDALKTLREESRYVRGLVSWVGFRQVGMPYERDARYAGKTKFGLFKMLRFALNGLTAFSEKPLRVASQLGFLIVIASGAFGAWLMAGKFLHPERIVQGWSSLMAVILLLGGVQLLCVGLLGEYVGRIYREAKRRPLYFAMRRDNFPKRSGTDDS